MSDKKIETGALQALNRAQRHALDRNKDFLRSVCSELGLDADGRTADIHRAIIAQIVRLRHAASRAAVVRLNDHRPKK